MKKFKKKYLLIKLDLPEYIIDRVKENANAVNIPYQSLMKLYIEKGAFAS